MKKALSLILIFVLCLAMTACSKDKGTDDQAELINPINVTISMSDSANDKLEPEDFKAIEKTAFAVEEGTNVLDATEIFCISNDLEISLDTAGTYVTTMLGFGEKDIEATTGWIFKVNGEAPTVSASEVVLKEGDEISWEFIDFTTYAW